jgi:hypothetical protein
MAQETLSTQNSIGDEFKIYPTVLTADKGLTLLVIKRQLIMLRFMP